MHRHNHRIDIRATFKRKQIIHRNMEYENSQMQFKSINWLAIEKSKE